MLQINNPENANQQLVRCVYCTDKNGKSIEIFFFDSANNMRISTFCPACGRKINPSKEEKVRRQ